MVESWYRFTLLEKVLKFHECLPGRRFYFVLGYSHRVASLPPVEVPVTKSPPTPSVLNDPGHVGSFMRVLTVTRKVSTGPHLLGDSQLLRQCQYSHGISKHHPPTPPQPLPNIDITHAHTLHVHVHTLHTHLHTLHVTNTYTHTNMDIHYTYVPYIRIYITHTHAHTDTHTHTVWSTSYGLVLLVPSKVSILTGCRD